MQYLKSSATRCHVSTGTSIIQSEQISTNGRCGKWNHSTTEVHLQAEQLRVGEACPAAPARGTREWLLSVAGVSLLCLVEAELELPDVVPLERA